MVVMAETTRIKAPIRVGFYDIAKTLGKGNYAVVKLAKHRITKTEVCLYLSFYSKVLFVHCVLLKYNYSYYVLVYGFFRSCFSEFMTYFCD